jgi:hypothetical protein
MKPMRCTLGYRLSRQGPNRKAIITFQVFTAESLKMTVVWDTALCSLMDRHFGGIYFLHNQNAKIIVRKKQVIFGLTSWSDEEEEGI